MQKEEMPVNGMEPERSCCTCFWHEGYTWIYFNGESLNCAEVTDPENGCECWKKRKDDDDIGEYELI